jgi:very-short-patch-repair endonuclease
MKGKQIIIGQKVNPIKKERAKQLRQVMTPEEEMLWYYLRSNQLNGLHFRRQQVINGFIADFYCHAVGVVIEIDGRIHERQKEYDVERDRIISSRGLQVIRIRNEEIQKDIYQVIQRILQVCESAKQIPGEG